MISTIAGRGGVAGYTGDGLNATTAVLYLPYDAVYADTGELFIADNRNSVIRMVSDRVSEWVSEWAEKWVSE